MEGLSHDLMKCVMSMQLIPTLVASSTVHSDNLDPELSYEIGISGASSLADIL